MLKANEFIAAENLNEFGAGRWPGPRIFMEPGDLRFNARSNINGLPYDVEVVGFIDGKEFILYTESMSGLNSDNVSFVVPSVPAEWRIFAVTDTGVFSTSVYAYRCEGD